MTVRGEEGQLTKKSFFLKYSIADFVSSVLQKVRLVVVTVVVVDDGSEISSRCCVVVGSTWYRRIVEKLAKRWLVATAYLIFHVKMHFYSERVNSWGTGSLKSTIRTFSFFSHLLSILQRHVFISIVLLPSEDMVVC